MTTARKTLFSLITLLAPITPALAQDRNGIDSGDMTWVMVSTALVLLMTIPGLALFYGGMVRKSNVLATITQSFATCCVIAVVWAVVGYSIAFGTGNEYVGDFSKVMLADLGWDKAMPDLTIPESIFMLFQMTFAIIAPAIISGAFADRMKFSSMLIFMATWSLIVYAPVAHWVWGGGFLGNNDGVLDYAGGTVVHINAGIAGLVCALVIGRRHGYGVEDFKPYNLVFSVIGASLLWVGWFGFNAGSALASDGSAGLAMVVTMLAGAMAGVAWMVTEWLTHGKPSVTGLISGAVSGLVAITPAAGFVDPSGALWIGLISGVFCYLSATKLKQALKYDDSLDCFGVHGIGGLVGAVLTGVFAKEAIGGTPGAIEGNWTQVWIQIEGVIATVVWCGVATFGILKTIQFFIGLRVSEEVERGGLDIALHGEALHH